jgi:hypothetical protein
MYTNVPHPCGRPGRAGDRPDQRNLSSRTTGLVSFFGSLPFRQLAGPAALFLCWPPRPARTASQVITSLSGGHRISIGTRQPAGRMPL